MPETMNERISRRKYLRYVGAGIAAAGVGYYLYIKNRREEALTLTRQTETSTIAETATQTPTLTPLASYAKSKGLSNSVIERLESKLDDKLTDNNKALIDYLYELSKAEVVSPEVLQFASNYKASVVETLQLKTIDQVVEEGKVPDLAVVGLGYLSTFPGYTQRWYIEQHGLDASAIDLLNKAKSLGNQDFAKYAVESLVCIQDHNPLSKAEIAFLENPGNKFRGVRDSYLADMESRGNPYDDFAKDWRKMLKRSDAEKEIESLDATEDWVYLVLNSDNPEVKEAEELKLKGGTPSQSDFKYSIPNYNTEQLVQYWLGKQNEFKENDTLTQAIAMVNGLWVTIGDDQVRKAVYKNTNERLNFGREIDEWQRATKLGYSLEKSSLLGKILWAWDGNENGVFGPNKLINYFLSGKKVGISTYESITASSEELRSMKNFMLQKGLISSSVDNVITKFEEYLWFDSYGNLVFPHWIYTDEQIHDAGYLLNLLLKTGKGKGGCNAEYTVIDTGAKAVGIPTTAIFRNVYDSKGKFIMGHMHTIYYDSQSNLWKGYHNQLEKGDGNRPTNETVRLFIMRPPVYGIKYFEEEHDAIDTVRSGHHYVIPAITRGDAAQMFKRGVSDPEMKRWLLYTF